MSSRFYPKIELSDSDFEEWLELLYEQSFNYDYLILELLKIINDSSPIHTMDVIPIM